MLNQNITTLRKNKGLSQEELADRLHVVRQTVSKWENGLSVPDADLLVSMAEILETSVSTLLGETVTEEKPDELKRISDALERINFQFAQAKAARRKRAHWGFLSLAAAIVLAVVCLFFAGSPYLNWNYGDPETAVAGTLFHAFEFFFVRAAPFALAGAIAGAILTRSKK